MSEEFERGPVARATVKDIDVLRRLSPELADSGLAASALAMAEEIDKPGNSATSKSMCARSLLEVMNRLRELAPEAEEEDEVDAARKRRAARLGGAGA
jgi:hypothetical protein